MATERSSSAPIYSNCPQCHSSDPHITATHWVSVPLDAMRHHLAEQFPRKKDGWIEAKIGWRNTIKAMYGDRAAEDGGPMTAEEFWLVR